MPRIAVAVLTLGIVAAAAVADADPIRLTHGALVGDDFGARLDAGAGDRTFVIMGRGDRVGGIYAVAEECNTAPECLPGRTLSLEATWSGSDFPGLATVHGTSYRLSGGNEANALVSFTGSWVAPAFDGRQMASVIAPFVFEGMFFYPGARGFPTTPLLLAGRGTTTLNLLWSAGAWEVRSTRYDFAAANATPEPMSLVLVATGVAGLVARRARRR